MSPSAVWGGEINDCSKRCDRKRISAQIMKHAAQQGDIENTRTKAASELLPLLARNEQRAPISLLSPAKRTALIQCFDNNGLINRKAVGTDRLTASPSPVAQSLTSVGIAC